MKKQEAELTSKDSKLEEEIVLHKTSKKFLDLLAIASKNKKPVNQKLRRKKKELLERQSSEQLDDDHQKVEKVSDQQTFVTQNSVINQKKRKTTVNKSSFIKSSTSNAVVDEADQRPSIMSGNATVTELENEDETDS